MKKLLQLFITFLFSQTLYAQSLEPRLYSNAPVGLNFLVLGYAYSEGALASNPSLNLENPQLKIDTAFLAYARVFNFLGQSAKVDVVIPTHKLRGTAIYQGKDARRDVDGIGDSKLRFSFNLFGAPALSLKNFASYKQDLIVGVSIQTTMPTGKYDGTKLVNLGTNRWAIKPGIGISKRINNFTFELAAEAEFYTQNNDFLTGHTYQQDPVYSTQTHMIYDFSKGYWLGLDVNYYLGGEVSIDNVGNDKKLNNSRLGITYALSINAKNSIKLYGHTGVISRTGTSFDMFGFAWQYRWTDGL